MKIYRIKNGTFSLYFEAEEDVIRFKESQPQSHHLSIIEIDVINKCRHLTSAIHADTQCRCTFRNDDPKCLIESTCLQCGRPVRR